MMVIQRRNSPLLGQGRLNVRFLDHVEGLFGRVISSQQAITLLQISNHSWSTHQSPLAIRPAETPSSKAGDWARNMATQFCLQSVFTLVGFFYML
jgi:hypothetical protein